MRHSVNPIDQVDLDNAKAWVHKNAFIKEKDREGKRFPYEQIPVANLPTGFGFDKYGLMVQGDFAVTVPESTEDSAEPMSNNSLSWPSPVDSPSNSSVNALVDAALEALNPKDTATNETAVIGLEGTAPPVDNHVLDISAENAAEDPDSMPQDSDLDPDMAAEEEEMVIQETACDLPPKPSSIDVAIGIRESLRPRA